MIQLVKLLLKALYFLQFLPEINKTLEILRPCDCKKVVTTQKLVTNPPPSPPPVVAYEPKWSAKDEEDFQRILKGE